MAAAGRHRQEFGTVLLAVVSVWMCWGVLTLSRIIGKPAFLAGMRVRSRTTGECSVWRMYGGTKVWKTVLRDCVQSHASFVVCTQTLR